MDWHSLFPSHNIITNAENPSIVESFGESPSDYKSLFKQNILSTDLRGYIQLSGPDTEKFLQGQVSCDMSLLKKGKPMNGAHLTPKGRITFLFSAHKDQDDNILLETHPSVVELAISSFKKYSVFFKTDITDVSDQFISAMISGPNSAERVQQITTCHIKQYDSSLFLVTVDTDRAIQQFNSQPGTLTPAGQGYSDLMRVRSGNADVTVDTSDEFIVQMINLDAQNYISFKKGCYTGQEIVARAHYRGSVKRRMHLMRLDTANMPSIGASLTDSNSKVIGAVAAAARASECSIEALAVLSEKYLATTEVTFDKEQFVNAIHLPLPYKVLERS
jgi:folate-binding protein YgfZ